MSVYREEVNKYLIAFQNGDKEQFAEFYNRMSGTFARHAMRILFDKQNWQDVLSESYLKISNSISSFKRYKDGYNWIMKIIENTAKTINARESKYCIYDMDNMYVPNGFDPYVDANGSIDFEIALKDFDEIYKTVAILYYRYGRTQEEIGVMLDMSKSAVCQRLRKIRSILKNNLKNS